METFKSLVQAAQSKGMKFEAFSRVFDRWGERVIPETFIQINTKDYFWSTWSSLILVDADKVDEVRLSFKERYNQANGSSQKTWNKEFGELVALGLVEKTW
jgi:hypothetical protein